MSNAIEINNLKKHFGKTHAVDGVSFEVPKGEIFGFLGPNGAGKTTTIRCLMDFIRPDAGEIKVQGLDAHRDSVAVKQKIGFLPADVYLYASWTGADHINFLRSIKGDHDIADELAQRLNFEPKTITHYLSTGNKQKLGLILALMYQPEIVILDEPTAGLDPLLQNQIYEILKKRRDEGGTIFMSSHNLPEVERVCDHVAIIKEGKLVATESISDLKRKKIYSITVYFDGDFKKEDFAGDGMDVTREFPNGLELEVKHDINPLIKKLENYKIRDLEITRASLEDIFIEFYQK